MFEEWMMIFIRMVGSFFIHPMLYVGLLMIFIMSYERIKKERFYFGQKLSSLYSEIIGSIIFSLLLGIAFSTIFVSLGLTFSVETILLLNIIMIILFIFRRPNLLSSAYTFGFVFLIVYFTPYMIEKFQLDFQYTPQSIELFSLALIVGFLLLAEALILMRTKEHETKPNLHYSKRGKWIGYHRLNRFSLIPFTILVPSGVFQPIENLWPILPPAFDHYQFIILPVFISFDYAVFSNVAQIEKRTLSKATIFLSCIVIALASLSIIYPALSFAAVVVAILGKEWIHYYFRNKERSSQFFYTNRKNGLVVLAILPNSPAERLGIRVGEIITRVNGKDVRSEMDLFTSLRRNGSFCKIEVINLQDEKRFVQGALYEGDHHDIGILTPKEPFEGEKFALAESS